MMFTRGPACSDIDPWQSIPLLETHFVLIGALQNNYTLCNTLTTHFPYIATLTTFAEYTG